MTTGQKIKAARIAADMTQAQLSTAATDAYAEVQQSSISRWEREGTISVPSYMLVRIAKALGVTFAELLGDSQ